MREVNISQRSLLAATISMCAMGVATPAFADDTFTLAGVTIYGTVDVGVGHQSAGTPLNAYVPDGLEYQAFTTTRNFHGSQTTATESAIEQSKLGIRVEEPTGLADVTAIAKLETGINPLSGEITDACKSLVQESGVAANAQTSNFDSSRCGQVFNGVAFGGLSSKTYGTLTIGRHNSLQLEATVQYDPQVVAPGFSFLGYSGFDGGAGTTGAARWDNAIRYAISRPQYRLALQYSEGGADTGLLGKSYGVSAGVTFGGLSIDAVYQRENGAVNLRSSLDNAAAPTSGSPPVGLAAYISTDTSFNVMGKYVTTLANKSKLTLFAGYSNIKKAHGDYAGGTSEGNYPISVGININAPAKYNFEWIGARYATPTGWIVSAAYYHISQNSWTIGLGTNGNEGLDCTAAGLLCAGRFDEASLVVDKVFNKHIDVYAGANFSNVSAGLANGFSGTTADGTTGSQSQLSLLTGVRLKF